MRFSELESRSLALWGFGREGRAALTALRARWPDKPVALLCPPAEHAAALAWADPALHLLDPERPEALAAFEVVIKSPGVSGYHPAIAAAAAAGTRFTSGTALWFGEQLPGLKFCVTGTKGKSTTTALLAHLLRARGLVVGLAGNIGLPLLELLEPALMPAAWAIELSSYQTADALAPDVAVVLNLFPEHLDWHGSEERYIADKLALLRQARPATVVLNDHDPRLRALATEFPQAHWFGREDGWHLRDGQLCRADQRLFELRRLRLPGVHNGLNLCAALTAIDAMRLGATALVEQAAGFTPLPHRLQPLGVRDGVEYVNDSISTTPHATLAALACYPRRPLGLILGGYDRGLPWDDFDPSALPVDLQVVVVRGQNADRIAAALQGRVAPERVVREADLVAGVAAARARLPAGAALLLSPGAPSFPDFRDYAERGRAFSAAAGFDPAVISQIPGLGIS